MGLHYTADEWTTKACTGCLPRGWMMNYGGPFSSVYPDEHDLAQFIHFLCVCERELLKAMKMKLNDVTRHQLTIDLLLSGSETQTAPYSVGAYQQPSGTICPFAGRAVIYCCSGTSLWSWMWSQRSRERLSCTAKHGLRTQKTNRQLRSHYTKYSNHLGINVHYWIGV